MGRYVALCSHGPSLAMDLPFSYKLCLLCAIFPSADHKLLHSVPMARRDVSVQERAMVTSSTQTKSLLHQLTW